MRIMATTRPPAMCPPRLVVLVIAPPTADCRKAVIVPFVVVA